MQKYIPIAVIAGIVLVILALANPFYTVNPGDEAVVLSFGNPIANEGPGLHVKMPIVQSVQYVSVQSHFADFDEESYSRDQQPAQIKFSVNYHVPPGSTMQVVSEYTSLENMVDRVLHQKAPAVFKNVFGTNDAQTAVQQRAKLNADFLAAMQASVEGSPLIIESVQVKDIKFDPAYEQAIQAKQKATVEVQTKEQELARTKVEAAITVTQAQAQADSELAVATNQAKAVELQGQAKATAIRAQGEAEALVIKAKADALNNNPNLIELTKAEAWNGALPTTMIPGSAIPFIDVATKAATP